MRGGVRRSRRRRGKRRGEENVGEVARILKRYSETSIEAGNIWRAFKRTVYESEELCSEALEFLVQSSA